MLKKYISALLILTISGLSGQSINGGSPKIPFNSNPGYGSNGIMPGNLPTSGSFGKSTDAANAYNSWKSNYVRDCGSDGSRVLFDDNSSTVSEGIGYGMLLAAYAGDKTLFDNLWKYYKAAVQRSGNKRFMDWKYSSCTGVSQTGGATDAEFDCAMALLVAEDQWPTATSPYDYKAEATPFIGLIRQYEMHPSTYQVLNGDTWGSTNPCRNPSYMAPAYFREFGKIENSSFWSSATSTANSFLKTNRNATTGLVSNWAAASNAVHNNCNGNDEYGFDACRNPWRMATDVLWNGSSTATTGSDICGKVAAWAQNYANNLKGPLAMDAANPSVGQYKNGTFSTYGLAFMAAGSSYQNALNTAYTNIVGLGNNEAYFSATLRAVTLFMMTGNFWKPGANITTATVSILTPTNNSTVNAGVSVSFTASASITAGSISKVEYYDGTTLLGNATTSPYTLAVTTLSGGSHTIVAKAYDGSGTLVATSASITVNVKAPSNISTTGVIDMFESKTELAEMTGGKNCSTGGAATAGVYWFQDTDASTAFSATYTRAGDGKLTYVISQPAKSYNVIGFNFGEYCDNGTSKKYSLDLSNNAVLKLTVSVPKSNSAALDLKVQAKDADGSVIAINKTFLADASTGNWYKYELGFSKNHVTPDYPSLVKGRDTTINFEFDLKNGLTIKNPNSPTFPADINSNNTDFDFTKVVEVVLIPVNAADEGAPNYAPLAFTNQTIIFSNLVFGNPSTGADICTTPDKPTAGTVSPYCQGATATALTATGMDGLVLKWYGTSATGGSASTTATVPSTSTAGTASYYVSQALSETSTCESQRTAISVTVNQSATPGVTVSQQPVGTVNEGTLITFTATATNAGTTPSYQWRVNGANQTGATSASYATSTLKDGDKVSVVLTSSAACASPLTATSSDITVSIVTSAEDEMFGAMELYPNPTNGILNVNGLTSTFEYAVMDNSGKMLVSGLSNNGTINLNEIQNGSYALVLKINGVQKIVKLMKN